MARSYIVLALVLGVVAHAGHANAQPPPGAERPWSGKWVFMTGWQRIDVAALNARMAANGLPSLPDGALSVGGGGWAVHDRFLFGGNGHALVVGDRSAPGGAFRSGLAGGYGQGDIGYVVHTDDRVDVYPTIGFGAGAATVRIIEQGSATFDQILADPRTMTGLTAWGFLLDAAAAADVRVTGVGGPYTGGTRGGLMLGLRAGYVWWPGDWTWDADAAPAFAVRGPYVRLMLGGWAR